MVFHPVADYTHLSLQKFIRDLYSEAIRSNSGHAQSVKASNPETARSIGQYL
jgi:hypothetical protein